MIWILPFSDLASEKIKEAEQASYPLTREVTMTESLCRRCKQPVDSRARMCPHCSFEHPAGVSTLKERAVKQKEAASSAIGWGVMAVLVAGIWMWCSGGDDRGSGQTRTTAPARQEAEIAARVRRDGLQLIIDNQDSFAWTNCEVTLNPGLFGGGWSQRVTHVGAGETISGGLLAFTKRDGERFNPATHALQTVMVACDTPQGYAVATFRFE